MQAWLGRAPRPSVYECVSVDLVTCKKNVEIRIVALVIELWRWAAEGSASGRACATRFFPFPLSSQAWRPSTPPDNQEGGVRAQHARHTRATRCAATASPASTRAFHSRACHGA